MIPELRVTMRNECTTWKRKNLDINESSTPVCLGMPSNRARSLKTIGRRAMRIASKTGGRIP